MEDWRPDVFISRHKESGFLVEKDKGKIKKLAVKAEMTEKKYISYIIKEWLLSLGENYGKD